MKKITNKKDWKVRKQGGEQLITLLESKGLHVKGNGLGDLYSAIKARLGEKNKSVLRLYIKVTGKLAQAIGKEIGNYMGKYLPALIKSLSDRSGMMKPDIIASLNEYAKVVEPQTVVNIMATFVEKGSPELKVSIIEFIL